MDKLTCDGCTNCALVDYGYSNYTVEGTTVICMIGEHPKGEFDRGWGLFAEEDQEGLAFAEKCLHYSSGGPGLTADVDGEDIWCIDDSAYNWWIRDNHYIDWQTVTVASHE